MITTNNKQTTKHNHEPNFGRRVDGCPRCEELKNGAAAVKGWGWINKQYEARKLAAIARHDFAACAAKNGVCTCFDW